MLMERAGKATLQNSMELQTLILCTRCQARGQVDSLEGGELRGMLSTRVSAEGVNKPTVVRVPFTACLESIAECNAVLTLQRIDFSECHAIQMRRLCQPVWVKPIIGPIACGR